MIKFEGTTLHIEGTRLELASEFMCIVKSLLNKGILDKDTMLFLIGLECIPEKDLKRMLINEIDKMDDIGEALSLLGKIL